MLGIVIDGYALILNSLASCACDAIEPPVPPAAHKVACIPDKIVVRVSGRYGVKVFAEAFCDIVTLYSVSGCPWCRDKEAIGVDPSFQFGMGVLYIHKGVAGLGDRCLFSWAYEWGRGVGRCTASGSVQGY